MVKWTNHRGPGRPKTKIKMRLLEGRQFFELADKKGLTLKAVIAILEKNLADAPSYRTLQEWRRGTHTPRFIPFKEWIRLLA
jgi:hypothetical protein